MLYAPSSHLAAFMNSWFSSGFTGLVVVVYWENCDEVIGSVCIITNTCFYTHSTAHGVGPNWAGHLPPCEASGLRLSDGK